MLENRAAPGIDSTAIADTVVEIFRQIELALAPVLGPLGVAALYKRTLYLTSPAHRDLAAHQNVAPSALAVDTLHAALAKRSRTDAIAAGTDFLLTFQQLLATLVGRSLTERLLRSVWNHSSSGTSAQDTTP